MNLTDFKKTVRNACPRAGCHEIIVVDEKVMTANENDFIEAHCRTHGRLYFETDTPYLYMTEAEFEHEHIEEMARELADELG